MTTDPIAAARALIKPLAGYTPGPWAVDMSYQWPSKVRAAPPFNDRWICDASSGLPHTLSNARLIAAAPALRDMVATLTDALDEIDRLREDRTFWRETARVETRDRIRLQEALAEIAAGDGTYGAQAAEYKAIAREALKGSDQ